MGNQDAWTALLQKYRDLIYSIPLKQGLSADAANDILQQVCVERLEQMELSATTVVCPRG